MKKNKVIAMVGNRPTKLLDELVNFALKLKVIKIKVYNAEVEAILERIVEKQTVL